MASVAARSREVRPGTRRRLAGGPKPVPDLLVQGDRAERYGLDPPLRGVQDEGIGLGTAEPAVRADLLLERGDLSRRGIEHADDQKVAALGHPVHTAKLIRGCGTESRQGIEP